MTYCQCCRRAYWSREGGACKDCYERSEETVEELQLENEELKAKIAFLRISSPLDHRDHASYNDVVLLAASDDRTSESAVPVLAHKVILVNRSPVLKATLENEMEEKQTATIEITDASHDVLCEFINYLYTAEISLDEKLACELLELAENYDVEHLKAYCEKFLVSKLNWENSITRYVFAHRHNAERLLRAALSLITNNMSKFIKRSEYMELVEKEPRLLVEIYEAYLSKQINAVLPESSYCGLNNLEAVIGDEKKMEI
ncbi:BTB/POZ domain-containing protein At4g08455-like [Mangifera indica]|uniref:BTB/POZ domain-containing protein At4g08455-like n=1 Tax=Mangifera indica TaxID=29780 RepID=UPI001CFB39AF|nr:BTB/POZ domain-containing protein At4g08455-like [Mangifera indica]